MTHPSIDFDKLPPIDTERFRKALFLKTTKLGRGQFRVVNPLDPLREPHNVDLYSSDIPRCDCGDHEFRQVLCKHILACLMAENHPVTAAELEKHFLRR